MFRLNPLVRRENRVLDVRKLYGVEKRVVGLRKVGCLAGGWGMYGRSQMATMMKERHT